MLCLEWRGTVRAAVLAVIVLTALGTMAPGVARAQATDDRTYEFDIPAQTLARSVAAIAAVTGYEVLYAEAEPLNVEAQAVTGRLTADAALRQLLTGTGFTYRYTQPRAITLERVQTGKVDGVRVLSPVRVEGAQGTSSSGSMFGPGAGNSLEYRNPTTEGTGSYTTGGMTVAAKMPLAPREIPNSVSVVTRQVIEDQGATTLAEALRLAPGVLIQDSQTGYNRLTIRGYDAYFSVDGIPQEPTLNNAGFTGVDVALYDRVEVRRGADGLLQGPGYPGGTIALVRRKPSGQFGADATVTAGRWNNYRLETAVTGPLTRDRRLRALGIAVIEDRDFFYDDIDSTGSYLVSGAVEYDITPKTVARFSLDNSSQKGPFYNGVPFEPNGTTNILERSTALVPSWALADRQSLAITTDVEHQLSADWRVKLAARREHVTAEVTLAAFDEPIDVTTQTVPIVAVGSKSDQIYAGADISIAGPFRAARMKHELVAGANWRTNDLDSTFGLGFPPAFSIANFNPDAPPDPSIVYRPQANTTNEDYGVYGSLRSHLTSKLTTVLGGRVSSYESRSRQEPSSDVVGFSDDYVLTPYAGVILDVSGNHSLYVSYADQFVSQADQLDSEGQPVDPAVGYQYEAGTKGEYLSGRLNASAAYFRTYLADVALRDPSFPEGINYYFNAMEQVSKGVDLELAGAIASGWQVLFGYTYNDSKYLRYPGNEAVVGQEFTEFVPQQHFRLATNYTFAGRFNGLALGGSLFGQSKIDGKKVGPDYPDQSAYVVAGVRLSYDVGAHSTVALNVNNVLDKHYLSGIGGSAMNYGVPREWVITYKARF